MTIKHLYPNTRPTLDLKFAKDKKLDPRITFSRESSGTYVDANGVIQSAASGVPRFDHDPVTNESLGLLVEEGRTNALNYSQNLQIKAHSTNCVAIPNYALAPDGTWTATKYYPLALFQHIIWVNIIPVTTVTASVFVKSDGMSIVRIGASGGGGAQQFNLSTGQLGTATSIISASMTPVGNGWYRCVATWAQTTLNSLSIDYFPSTINGTDGLLLWGAQLETGSFPTSYIPTPATFTSRSTTATFYDANGVIQTAGVNVARSNAYFPDSSGVMRPAGLLLEGSGTNLVTNSTSVTATGGTATLNGGSSPDGGTASILLTANQTGGYVQGNSGFTVSTITHHTISFWYKDGTGTATSIRIEGVLNGGGRGYFIFNDLNDGTDVSKVAMHTDSYGIQVFPNGWKRFYMGYNSTSGIDNTGSFVFRIRINGIQDTQTCYLFGLQAETGSYPTSYIPTDGTPGGITRAADVSTSSTVTRSADVAQITGSNFSSWYNQSEGTLYINAANVKEEKSAAAFSSAVTGTPDTLYIYRSNSTQWRIYNTNQIAFNDSTDFANAALAYSVDGNTRAGFAAWKGSIVNIATDISHVDFAYLQIGVGPKSTGQCNGHISRLTYYPIRLSNAILQTITS